MSGGVRREGREEREEREVNERGEVGERGEGVGEKRERKQC
jgi:hypothetical protein